MPPAAIGGAVAIGGSLLGAREQRRAAGKAAEEQTKAGREAIDVQEAAQLRLEERLQPFAEAGTGALPLLIEQITGPQPTQQEQAQAVLSNPFFRALADDQEQRLLASAAARGRVGAGGTQDALTRNLLLLGNQFQLQGQMDRERQLQNLFGLTELGQRSAAGIGSAGLLTGSNIANLATQLGNVQAARQAQIGASRQVLPDLLVQESGFALGAS